MNSALLSDPSLLVSSFVNWASKRLRMAALLLDFALGGRELARAQSPIAIGVDRLERRIEVPEQVCSGWLLRLSSDRSGAARARRVRYRGERSRSGSGDDGRNCKVTVKHSEFSLMEINTDGASSDSYPLRRLSDCLPGDLSRP